MLVNEKVGRIDQSSLPSSERPNRRNKQLLKQFVIGYLDIDWKIK